MQGFALVTTPQPGTPYLQRTSPFRAGPPPHPVRLRALVVRRDLDRIPLRGELVDQWPVEEPPDETVVDGQAVVHLLPMACTRVLGGPDGVHEKPAGAEHSVRLGNQGPQLGAR